MGRLERLTDGFDQIALHGVDIDRPPQPRGKRLVTRMLTPLRPDAPE